MKGELVITVDNGYIQLNCKARDLKHAYMIIDVCFKGMRFAITNGDGDEIARHAGTYGETEGRETDRGAMEGFVKDLGYDCRP